MKNFGIQEPCNENWSAMTPTEKGAFCQQCAKQVIDFTSKSTDYIKSTLLKNKNESLCGRMTLQQELDLQNDFALWEYSSHQRMRRISLYAFILVFGLSIVSCADEKDKEVIQQLHQSSLQLIEDNKEMAIVVNAEQNTANTQGTEITDIETIGCYFEKEIDVVTIVQPELEEIEIVERPIYVTMGAMVSPTYRHVQYLEETIPARLDENGVLIPTEFSGLVYPNPTSGLTKLKIATPSTVKASIIIFSATGELTQNLGKQKFREGTSEIDIDLSNEQVGTYFVQFLYNGTKEIFKVTKL